MERNMENQQRLFYHNEQRISLIHEQSKLSGKKLGLNSQVIIQIDFGNTIHKRIGDSML